MRNRANDEQPTTPLPEEDETTLFPSAPSEPRLKPKDTSTWLVVLAGRSVGRMFRLEAGEVTLGRSSTCDVVLDDEGVSREHARFRIAAKGPHELLDLDSRNGTFVEDVRLSGSVVVRDGDRIRLGPGTILKLGLADELEQQVLVQLYNAATRDGLTGLFNKRYLLEQIEQETAWHRRHEEPMSLILLDLDAFKRVNTTCGHLVGDEVLQELARRLTRGSRTEDTAARFGGEEFAIILRNTPAAPAAALAERLRVAVASTPFEVTGRSLTVTASFGVATLSGAGLRGAELLTLADQRLREAKARGRNRVVAEPGTR